MLVVSLLMCPAKVGRRIKLYFHTNTVQLIAYPKVSEKNPYVNRGEARSDAIEKLPLTTTASSEDKDDDKGSDNSKA